jgi:hypothetical protein
MPLFQNSPKLGIPLALAKDKDRILAYALTPAAVRRLQKSGVRHGRRFPSSILLSLIRTGDAHSPRPADGEGQAFLFTEDDVLDQLPRCETTGTTADLHLVVYRDSGCAVAKLLSIEARFILQKVTSLSVPIWGLSEALVDQMEATDKLPRGTEAAKTLRQWFIRDYEGAWEKLRKAHAQQETLDLGAADGELPLVKVE